MGVLILVELRAGTCVNRYECFDASAGAVGCADVNVGVSVVLLL